MQVLDHSTKLSVLITLVSTVDVYL